MDMDLEYNWYFVLSFVFFDNAANLDTDEG